MSTSADSRLRSRTWRSGFAKLGGPAESLEADVSGTLEELCVSLEQVLDVRTTKTALLREVEEAGTELESSLGRGEEADSSPG